MARLLHRLSASVAAAMVLLIAYLSWVQQPRVRSDIALSAAIVVLTIFLAGLGRWSGATQVPLVTLGNLLGGMTLMTLLQWTKLRTSRAHASTTPATSLAHVAENAAAADLLLAAEEWSVIDRAFADLGLDLLP